MPLNVLPPYITEQKLVEFISSALLEDVGNGDHTSLSAIAASQQGKAQLIFKDKGTIAGMAMAKKIFEVVDPTLKMELFKKDGDSVNFGDIGLIVSGNVHAILKAERLVLNCLQRMSGIATLTQQYISAIKHTKAKLLDTRKTTPNFRLAEKWAVAIGGGHNHRYGLYDMILLKDNHIDYAGGVSQAIKASKKYLFDNQLDLKIEVEVRNLQELEIAMAEGGLYRIMLDNMNLLDMNQAVSMVNGKIPLEASGGVTLNTIAAIAETGVDYISVGALTHSVKSMDISLKACK